VRCDFSDSLLQSYFDGELSAFRAAEFERHVQRCADCAEQLVNQDLLSGTLQLAQLHAPAPASLRRKILAECRTVGTAAAVSEPLLWHWLAAVAALLLIALIGWKVSPGLGNEDYQAELAGEIVEVHIRSLQPGHATGIASNDEYAVRGWFDGKVKFPVPVRDFAKEGFVLKGGRLDVMEGRSVAALVYVRDGYLFNVFVWPTREADSSPRTGSRQDYHWVDWRKRKMEFCAVSDADPAEIEQLRQLIQSFS
jgi:anti-sigma factor RsiW